MKRSGKCKLIAGTLLAVAGMLSFPGMTVMASDESKPEVGRVEWKAVRITGTSDEGIPWYDMSYVYDPITGHEIRDTQDDGIRVYEYDSNGNLAFIRYYDENNEPTGAYDQYVFSDDNARSTVYPYVNGDYEVYVIYYYDLNGNILRGEEYNLDDICTSFQEVTYWDNGNTKSVYTANTQADSAPEWNYSINCDENGNILSTVYYKADEQNSLVEASREEYVYEDGIIISYRCYEDSELRYYITYTHEMNENGYVLWETTHYEEYDPYTVKIVCEFDEFGNKIRETRYNSDGTINTDEIWKYVKFEYDVNGNYIPNYNVYVTPEGEQYYWVDGDGRTYWYENSIRQGTYKDANGVMGDGTIRGREIYDPVTDGWYWLDAIYDGAKAVDKEVWMPYIYQNEGSWDEAEMRRIAYESDEGMGECVLDAMLSHSGKWVRYDADGRMLKGWVTIEGALAELYPDQAGNTYYYDHRTGLMAKGFVTLDGVEYHFDETFGNLIR